MDKLQSEGYAEPATSNVRRRLEWAATVTPEYRKHIDSAWHELEGWPSEYDSVAIDSEFMR